jgi:hypothetical protein
MMTRQRRPSGCAAVVWAFVGVCALIALAEVYPLITAPLAGLLVVLIVLGAISQHRARAATPVMRSAPCPVRHWHVIQRQRGLAPCPTCGAPNKGSDFCPLCGSVIVTEREVHGVTEVNP